jgi:hypothetical protein
MNTAQAIQIAGTLSKPSKMPGFAIGIPAKECKTGSKLRLIKGSVCHGCYALKGCYVFPVVQAAQYKRLAGIPSPLWVKAVTHLISSKRSKEFRWHDSGDVQDLAHLNKIFEVCRLTPSVKHWMPTREAWVKPYLKDCPDNLAVRFSMPMVDQPAAGTWSHTSTVVTSGATCPAPKQDGKCGDCRACWDKSIPNISYGKH